jgi:hypothetical protein
LLNWHWSGILKVELEQTSEGSPLDRLSRVLGVCVVGVLVLLPDGVLKLSDGDGVIDSHLGSLAVVVFSAFGLKKEVSTIERVQLTIPGI